MSANQQHETHGARTIDWSSAEFSKGTLVVELNGVGAKGWSKDFAGVLALLEQSGRGWSNVTLKSARIRVSDVQVGSEEDLRHFLESVVLQVNSDLGLESETDTEDVGTDKTRSSAQPPEATERRMAATFRGFSDEGS
jgi:hypothetical protein